MEPQHNTPSNMQDIKHRSIRDLKIHRTFKRNGLERPSTEEGGDNGVPPSYSYPQEFREPLRRPMWKWALGVVIVVLVLFVVFASIFTNATITATPRFETVAVDASFTAYRNPSSTDLGVTFVTLAKEEGMGVPARGEEQVDTKASGKIIVFNDYSEEAQRLVKNTRFETPEGLIYRISESVDVPGHTINETGNTLPGSVEVAVYAETSGEEYNIDLVDFTIPGFAGEPQFDHFYARSKTPMTGGFSGVRKVASEEDVETAREKLQTKLEGELAEEIGGEIPPGFVFFNDAIVFVSERVEGNGETGTNVTVTERVTAYAVVFNENDLARHIAEQTVATYDGAPVRLDGVDAFSFSFNDLEAVRPAADETISFSLGGSGTIVWTYDRDRLAEDVADKHRRDIEMILSGYPAIKEARIQIFPFWKRSFPRSAERIVVEEKIEVD